MLGAIASNHFGPAACSDSLSLSKSSIISGFKISSDFHNIDFYPMEQNLSLIFTVRMLDCWRVYLVAGTTLKEHFRTLGVEGKLPSLVTLLRFGEDLF